MEISVDKLSEEVEKIGRGQDEIREKVRGLQENELLQLRQKIIDLESYVKLISKIGPLVVIAATIVLTLLGWQSYSAWKTGLENAITTSVEKKYDSQISQKLDQATYLNADIEEMVKVSLRDDESKSANDALCILRQYATDQLEREYLFTRYMDVCLKKGIYGPPYELLEKADANKIFPSRYKLPSTFINSAVVLWVKSLPKNPNDSDASHLVKQAQSSLHMAEETAKDNKYYRHIRDKIRRKVVYHLFFISLSENNLPDAREFLDEYLNSGEEIDWSKVTDKKWFQRLKKHRPHVQKLLAEELCASTFPNGITKTGRK